LKPRARFARAWILSAMIGSFWMATAMPGSLAVATAAAGQVAQEGERWILENDGLRVVVEPRQGQVSVTEKTGGVEWRQVPSAAGAGEPAFREVRKLDAPARGVSFVADFPSGNGKVHALLVKLSLAEKASDLLVEADMAERGAGVGNLPFLRPFVLESPGGAIVIADYSDGHVYSLEAREVPRRWFTLGDIDMPWIGVCDLEKGSGYAIIVDTPDDAYFELQAWKSEGRELVAPRVGWTDSKKAFSYARKLFYHFSPGGGYVALAKRYRKHAQGQGLLVPLSEKLKKNPNLSRLFGAPDVWGDGSLKFAREAKAAGIEKMLIHGKAPAEEMKAINDLGYLTSNYDNYTDIFQVEQGKDIDSSHGRLPDDVVLKADDQRMTAWLTWDKKQYMKRCPALWLPSARIVVPKDLARHPFIGRFVDVTTAEGLYECYDPMHPLTRAEKRACGVALLDYVRSLGLVTGGEHGRWWAVPCLDYIEGMMSGGSYSWPAGHLTRPKSKDQEFVSPWGNKYSKWADYEKWGIGHGSRVPLWELVFHDCIVTTWYWGDSSDFLLEAAPEVTPKKDAFNVLYGTIPILWANKEGGWHAAREDFLKTYRNTCKLHEVIAGTEMLRHEFLTPDRAVQRTEFSGGTKVVVNFGEKPYPAELDGASYLLPRNGFAVRGPRIEQSLALVGGKPVTTIRCGEYRFSDGK
jgi:hypothetical protein